MEFFLLPFMQRALLAGVLAAVTSGILGVFVVLRRSSFFGDAVSHASLAGVALALLLNFNPLLGAAAVALFISFLLHKMEHKSHLAIDTLLGIILPFFMAIGVLIISLSPGYQPDLMSYLFGSILSVTYTNLVIISLMSIIIIAFTIILKKQLTLATFDEDQAALSGVRVELLLQVYLTLLALTVIINLKTLGIILANALLIIPAATAKQFATSLRALFLLTPVIALCCVTIGLIASYIMDLPSGPAIVVVTGIVFLSSYGIRMFLS